MVDIAVGEYISDKTPKELVSLYELLLARNSQQKLIQGKRVGVHEVNVPQDLGSQVAELSHQMQQLLNRVIQSQEPCAYYHMYGHSAASYYNRDPSTMVEDVNFTIVHGRQKLQLRNDPFFNTYNEGQRNHPNFSWKDQVVRSMGPLGFQNLQQSSQYPPQLTQEKKTKLEEMMLQYMKKVDQRMDQFNKLAQSQQAFIQNLER